MSKKKARPSKRSAARRDRKHWRAMAFSIALILSITAGLLAQWRSLPAPTMTAALAPEPAAAPEVAGGATGLSKEYIYAGGKLIATEGPNSGGGGQGIGQD